MPFIKLGNRNYKNLACETFTHIESEISVNYGCYFLQLIIFFHKHLYSRNRVKILNNKQKKQET